VGGGLSGLAGLSEQRLLLAARAGFMPITGGGGGGGGGSRATSSRNQSEAEASDAEGLDGLRRPVKRLMGAAGRLLALPSMPRRRLLLHRVSMQQFNAPCLRSVHAVFSLNDWMAAH
jgi:hypothetical protein